MKQIEVKQIIVDKYNYSARYIGGGMGTGTEWPIITEEEWVITEEDGIMFENYMKKIKVNCTSLLGGKTVFFDDSATFPRRKFKASFPNNKLVSAEKADVIVVDEARLASRFYLYTHTYHLCSDGHYSQYRDLATVIKEAPAVKFHTEMKEKGKRMNLLLRYEGKSIINLSSVSLKSPERLDLDAFRKIDKMLKGNDDSMKNIGMQLLTAYDYNEEKYKIHAMLALNWYSWNRSRSKISNVEVKSMMRKLDLDFPGYQYHTGNEFWFKMSIDYPDDEVIQEACNIWVKTFFPSAPFLKIIKIE